MSSLGGVGALTGCLHGSGPALPGLRHGQRGAYHSSAGPPGRDCRASLLMSPPAQPGGL